ncbi:hypothetical protein TNCV_1089741 [Trichonephila clavipes]|uniref:Uncharacterized protein n=1 Tax=Trichonephila clavipes TaxID=2585209 RepID=A0A8X6VQ55_TRICX|nr:hypothetical protein TNCV_1089741 [Trichonephila clavipes]
MPRKNLPKLTEDKNLTRGEFDWAGSENITCMKWKDKRYKKRKDFQNGSYSLACSYGQRRDFQKTRKLSLPVQVKAHKFSVPDDVRLANVQHLPVVRACVPTYSPSNRV